MEACIPNVFFFFFRYQNYQNFIRKVLVCPMGSEGAVFSHSPGEFYGIKQLLMGGAAVPMMEWG